LADRAQRLVQRVGLFCPPRGAKGAAQHTGQRATQRTALKLAKNKRCSGAHGKTDVVRGEGDGQLLKCGYWVHG